VGDMIKVIAFLQICSIALNTKVSFYMGGLILYKIYLDDFLLTGKRVGDMIKMSFYMVGLILCKNHINDFKFLWIIDGKESERYDKSHHILQICPIVLKTKVSFYMGGLTLYKIYLNEFLLTGKRVRDMIKVSFYIGGSFVS
jgi:hypothetical protein